MDGDALQIARMLLKLHEGLRLKPYKDTRGNLTIGYGRNLDAVGIYNIEAEYLLRNDIYDRELVLRQLLWWGALDPVRQAALLDLAYNLGSAGLLNFKHMLRAIELRDWKTAADQLRQSLWIKHVQPSRSEQLLKMIEYGVV